MTAYAARRGAPVLERILSPLRMAIDDNGCFIWTGSVDTNGYPLITVEGKTRKVYHLAWANMVGPCPEDLEPDHTCRVRRCFNPEHLEWVTHKVNTLRGNTIVAKWAARTECHICGGHLEPTTRPSRTGRFCRTCKNRRERERRYESRMP